MEENKNLIMTAFIVVIILIVTAIIITIYQTIENHQEPKQKL